MSPRAGGVAVGDAGKRRGIFRRALAKLASPEEGEQGADQQHANTAAAATPINSCADRQVVELSGDLTSVTPKPRGGKPVLEAELADSSGTVTLVWLGRQQIPGIEAGRRVSVCGRVSYQADGDRRVMFNPRYELRCPPQT